MHRRRPTAILHLAALLFALPVGAAQAPLLVAKGEPAAKATARPQLAARERPEPLARLFPLAWEDPDRLFAVADRNARGALPLQDGVARALPEPREVRLDARRRPSLRRGRQTDHAGGILARERGGDLRWLGRVEVGEAWRLRLELADLRLPHGGEIWVIGADGETVGPFGAELAGRDRTLWTPEVAGPDVAVEVRLPRRHAEDPSSGRLGFTIASLMEIFELGRDGVPLAAAGTSPKGEECQVDAQCVDDATLPGIDVFQRGVAHIRFISGGGSFICSGGLLSDTDPNTVIPYFLTANHCLSSQSAANTLSAFFDYATGSCDGPDPGTGAATRVQGATLLATSEQSDFTLLRLNTTPPGTRTYFGWTTIRQPIGSEIHRIAHPSGKPQVYSRTRVLDSQSPFRCTGLPIADFHYSDETFSGTAGGSSGGVAFTTDGQVVGQLFGSCGSDVDDPCGHATKDTIDGFFGSSFPAIAQFLDPPTGAACTPNATTLCFLGGRYEARLDWRNQFAADRSGVGGAVPLTDFSGLFYFDDAANIELMVKVLDFGGGVVKVFFGQLTNLQFSLRLRDTTTGRTKIYSNTPGECGAIDESFHGLASDLIVADKLADPVEPTLAPCVQSPTQLCLLDNRFAVEADWRNQFNGASGAALTPATPLSRLSGTFTYEDPRNVELLVKTLDFGDRILFIWGALSNLEYTIRVTDTQTGRAKTYFNPAGRYCGGLDNDFDSEEPGGTTIAEREPNNTQAEAQTLSAATPITVFGRAEKADVGQLAFTPQGGSPDDLEDLYRVSIGSPGLRLMLSELGADCDLYLYDNNGTNVLGISNDGDFVDETIDLPDLPAGNYLVAVSIWDEGGDPDTNYRLEVDGDL